MRESHSLDLTDAAVTHAVGRKLGVMLRQHPNLGALIGLSGELGAGKTSFVAGVLNASGVAGAIRSPTYTLIEPYELQAPVRTIFHLDLYRLRSAAELEELGVRELLWGNNVLLVEWIENAPSLVAASDLGLRLSYAPVGRALEVHSRSAGGALLASGLVASAVTEQRS